MFRVASLHVYPLKSAAGLDVHEAVARAEGFAWDRRWMIVDAAGRFVTQRGWPRLARVEVGLAAAQDEAELTVRVPGVGEAVAPSATGRGARVEVEVWGDRVLAEAVAPRVDELLSAFLEMPVRVVGFPPDAVRPCDPAYARAGDRVGFADGFPYLVTTTGSLAALEAEVGASLEMRRFRPNIVVGCDTAWAEDGWREATVAGLPLRLVKPCGRCTMVTVDPTTGRAGREPLRTLNRTRRQGRAVIFGQNAVLDAEGLVRVGDPFAVTGAEGP
jgi:uncharacterized protein YcbX